MKKIFSSHLFVVFWIAPFFCFAKLELATTTSDLAAVVKQVGKDKVEVFSIAKGTQDPHQIEAKPSFMVKLRTVDLVIAQGLELESAWIKPLTEGSRNPKIIKKEGLFELGALLDPIEVATEKVSRADGDVHPGGNPHFQLDPVRIGKAAVLIAKKLGELEPAEKDFFLKNAEGFQKNMEEKTKEWSARIKKAGVSEIVTYHKSFSYFCHRFDIKCDLQLEPKPGIPPTASHLISVIAKMKEKKLNLVFIENLYEDAAGLKLKQEIPAVKVVRLPIAVEGDPDILTNEQLFERLVKAVENGK